MHPFLPSTVRQEDVGDYPLFKAKVICGVIKRCYWYYGQYVNNPDDSCQGGELQGTFWGDEEYVCDVLIMYAYI